MAEHIALYRKYRPKEFKDVIGQDHIVNVLEQSVARGAISHAYLFSGTRGTGKTSIARIFARGIGTSTNDLYEIDAASNRGIDDVREIRDGVSTLPFDSKYKVYIIDEVHMLTKEAFNALLKTLEEPPIHAVFILATTEIDKLPETIVSRCQTFHFRRPTERILVRTLEDVAKKEKVKIEKAASELIALLGEGSFRDTLGIFEKVMSGVNKKDITVEAVENLTGAPKRNLVRAVVESIASKKPEKGIEAVQKAAEDNVDMKVLIRLVLELMRNVLLARYSPKFLESLREQSSDGEFQLIESLSGNKDINSATLSRLLEASAQISRASVAELPIELAIVELAGEQ